ncbi:MFS transporter [Ideonella sp. A 288]|uniref:MFS transporter n=1 Tax=Ideonella sp. A 288 TaxID=1962181 RepID=UPI000B4AECCF|nr:MFS transporter [Ideonella sp. A 288]
MNNTYLRGIYLRLAGAVTLVVMIALVANAVLSHRTFEQALAPQMASKVASVGASVRALVLKAVENGVPFNELYGVNERFDDIKDEAPEVTYVAIADAQGAIRHEHSKAPAGLPEYFKSQPVLDLLKTPDAVPPAVRVGSMYMVSMPIASPDQTLGMLHIGVDVRFVDEMVLDMLFDVIVVLVVSLFFTLELLHFMAGAKLEASLKELGAAFERGASGNFATRSRLRDEQAFGTLLKLMDATLARINQSYAALAKDVDNGRHVPAHERHPGLTQAQTGLQSLGRRMRFGTDKAPDLAEESQLPKVRAPLFVFILAEELTRSFLPGYVNELQVPMAGISPQVVVGLPIALFMFIVAIGQPFLGVYCERVGHRRTMLVGAAIAAGGFLATAMAVGVFDLLLWRSLCALGYAMVFVAGQAYVLDHATPTTRASSFALFVGAIMAATVCGPSIGGILADNIGVRPTFFIAALLAASSILVIRQMPATRAAVQGRQAVRLPTLREIGGLVLNRRFMTVTGLAAMPAKILLTGVCFYLIPLYITSVGSTQAMAGRILMTYAVMMVVLAPVTATLATTSERMHWLVGGGLAVSGIGGLIMLAGGGVGWVFLAVTLVGLGQSMSISAQSALVSEHCAPEIARLGEGVVYGVYRLLERIGNALGPLIAAALVLRFDYRTGFVAIGGAVLACGVGFVLSTRHGTKPALAAA